MAEDDGTRRWQRIERHPKDVDPLQLIRAALAAVRRAPGDPEARRRLRALAADQALIEQVALLLADEARAAQDRSVAAAFYEELADVQENLDQPLETIAAMERVIQLEPDNAEHHDRLAWLYRRAEAWIKAAEAYERVAGLAPDERGRAALRAAGKLYRDHGRVDRATSIYETIVARWPSDADAWRALDEILTERGRWQEAALVRGERATRAKGGVDKAALLRSQARALEHSGDLSSAAILVAQASTHAPDNVSGLVDYADVLARSGQGREAAAILATRIDEAIDRGAATDDVAALRLRLFDILDEAAGDRARAAMVMADLLAAAPEHVPALERLAAKAAREPDPRAHAAALLRYATALTDPHARGHAVLEAARRFRAAGDHRASAAAFEDAVTLVDDERVRRELDDARIALAVDHAAERTRGGDVAGAERQLREILASRPASLEANLGLVALLSARGKLEAAAEQLRDALAAAPDGTPGERLAPLVHRFAAVMAELGDDEESHQLLHEAHRLDRKSITIQLALGESCFARRLWRQAALHLGSLADHPDAPRHAAEVARALVHAAQAEVRSLRPANAAKHHEAAVRLDPACAPAWHALGEAAMDRGDVAQAVEHLEREADATTVPRDRVRLFDALGDLASDVLDDPERAERCWSRIAGDGDPAILEKLLVVQRRRGAGVERGATCERLAGLATDARRAKALLEEAAEAFAVGGDLASATPLAERLIAAHPRDVDAVACASAIALAAGDARRAASWLDRALAAWDAAGARGDGDPRRAELWRRLGDARRALGASEAALTAYRRAVSTAADSEGALAARRGLVALVAATGETAVTSRMELVEAEQDPGDVLAWARDLVQTGATGDAWAAFALARAIGAVLDEQDHQLLATSAPRPMASDEAYAGSLDDAELRALVDDPEEGPLAELCELLGEAAQLVCPDPRSALVEADLLDATRTSATSEAAVSAIYPQIARALGGPATLLFTTTRRSHPDVALLFATPPVVVFGPRLAGLRARSHDDLDRASAQADPAGDTRLRFELGRIVELSRPRRIFLAQPPDVFEAFVRGLRHAFGPPGPDVERAAIACGARVHAATPVQLRRRITTWFHATAGELDAAAYRAACERAADRAGLLASGDIGTAIELVGGVERAGHLVQLASSRRYLAARRKLRTRATDETTRPFTR